MIQTTGRGQMDTDSNKKVYRYHIWIRTVAGNCHRATVSDYTAKGAREYFLKTAANRGIQIAELISIKPAKKGDSYGKGN